MHNGEYIDNINPGITPFDIKISDKRIGYVCRNYFTGINPFMQIYLDECKLYNYSLFKYIMDTYLINLSELQIKRKEYYLSNSEKERVRSNEWYKNHKEEIKSKPSWRQNNPELAKEKDKLYYTMNRERILKYAAIRREENREESKKYFKDRYENNKEAICLNRQTNRHNLFNSWINKAPFNGVCHKCGKKVNYDNKDDMPEFHHTIPENKKYNLYYLIVNLNSPDEVIWNEINSGGVVLLCSKCHKEETALQQSVPKNTVNDIVSLYESGMQIKDISEKVGYERHTIAKILKAIYPGINLKFSLPPSKIKEAKSLYESGIGICSIAEKFGVNRKTMSSILKE